MPRNAQITLGGFDDIEDLTRRFRIQDGNAVESEAQLQLQVDKAQQPLLATLTSPGSSAFLTTIKPCGILLPHVHPRATELYVVMSGVPRSCIASPNPLNILIVRYK